MCKVGMTKIRVLHIMDKVSADGSRIHGPARQIAYRVPCYPAGRFEVMLLNLRGADAACDVLRQAGVEVVSLNKGKFDPLTLLDVLRVMREWRPSVLHLHGYASFNFGRVAGRIRHVPVVIQEHFVDERLPGYQRAIDWCLQNWQAKALAVSQPVADFMIADRYVPAEQMEVLVNGLPVDRFVRSTTEERLALRRQLGIPDGAIVVGTAGRLAEMKGHHYFLRAAKAILETIPGAWFVIVGEGPWAGALRAQGEELGLGSRLVFTGYQEQMAPYLSLMDIGVIASIFNEGFNTVGVEMLAAGLPLVITDLPCFHEVYAHNENVLMVPPRDERSLAEAVVRLWREPELAQRLVQRGRETVNYCRIDRIAARYAAIYEDVVKSGRAGGSSAGRKDGPLA